MKAFKTANKTARIFDIANIPFANVEEEEKKVYIAAMKQTGSYQGYKPRQYWVIPILHTSKIFLLIHLLVSTLTMASVINSNIIIVCVEFSM